MTILIERLPGLPVDSLAALIAESEQAGLRFIPRLVEEWGTGANRFDRSGEALFAAWVTANWSAFVGLTSTRTPPTTGSAACDTCTSGRRSGDVGRADTW